MSKDVFLRTTESRLETMTRQIEDLHARTDTLSDESRAIHAERIEALRRQEERLRRKLQDIRTSAEADWRPRKTGVDRDLDEFQKAIEKTILAVRDEID
jgi:chaperonin cofactor prefoldin